MNRRNFLKALTAVVTCMSIHPHEFLTPSQIPDIESELMRAIAHQVADAMDEAFWGSGPTTLIVHPDLKKQYELALK